MQHLHAFWGRIFSLKMGLCLALGFSSGMPLYVLLTLLTAFLRSEGTDLKQIGLFSLLMIPYTWKFLWSPFIDRYAVPFLDRRRGWILVSQCLLIISIALIGFFSPKIHLSVIAFLALAVAFFSATQDIAIDAFRREFLDDEELGLGNSLFVKAYRVAGLVPGGLSLVLAQYCSWHSVFVVTALCMVPGVLATFFAHEKKANCVPKTLKAAVIDPWREFLKRRGIFHAILIIAFVFLYKLGDSMATALATPFYIDLGYDLMTIGVIAKNVGLWSTVTGGLLGGMLMLRIGIGRALWLFGFGQMITVFLFAVLARNGEQGIPPLWLFSLVIGAESLGAGLGTAAFVSFIASQTNETYTATQFALLTSLSALPRTFCNAATGFLVENLGWENFFWLCTVLCIPGMLLLFKIAPLRKRRCRSAAHL